MRLLLIVFLMIGIYSNSDAQTIKTTKANLLDKLKGGWAGQTIGVAFGGPYEFQFNGTFIQDYQNLNWKDDQVIWYMKNSPGLYDDIYMDLTFVEVFNRLGLDAPVDSFAAAYANAGYMLWHANQAGRYNILNGIKAPASGHWLNNPHADDIDFQIEADFAGLMAPAMPGAAAAISDKIGHIMNYGDGYYGGVYIATMYSLAITATDIKKVVKDALKAIPAQSDFYKCISDVIKWQAQYPTDWHQAWYEIQKKWSSEVGCPDGVFAAFNIDAKINAAYVVLGLLYGNGDFGKTMEVATRAGQDADCNPSSACGVLGAMLGYSKIPATWKKCLDGAEDIDFKYTTMSLNKTYATSFDQALQTIIRNGGKIDGENVWIKSQPIKTVPLEVSFPGLKPTGKISFSKSNLKEESFEFEGSGFVLRGEAQKVFGDNIVIQIAVSIDGGEKKIYKLPTNFTTRRHEICWEYQLPPGKHTVVVKRVDGNEEAGVLKVWDYIVYRKV